MRTTLDIDEDVLEAAKELAKARDTTAGRVISELARQALTSRLAGPAKYRGGFRILPKRGGVITTEMINQLAEEEI
jgi:hypothetical protein